MPTLAQNIHGTAQARRQIAIKSLGGQLNASDPHSAASRLAKLAVVPGRPMLVSSDIDGLVSASMLASVTPDWKIVAFVAQSQRIVVHPNYADRRPANIFGIDVFSPQFDNVSNHVVLYGSRRLKIQEVLLAFQDWDTEVLRAAGGHLLAVPALWAMTEASYEGSERATSAKYKYPFGTAQILLALLEAGGLPPRFYDRNFLPWLVANCDGGVSTYTEHAYNAEIWWSTLAGAVGPASLTEQIYSRVSQMRPHDFINAVNRLDRERNPALTAWLDDKWNLVDESRTTIERTLQWIDEITGWGDPVLDGLANIHNWTEIPISPQNMGAVYLSGDRSKDTKANPTAADASIRAAFNAVNANFYFGGFSGSRFNWVGGW
jgi:hypothetical protein